MRHIFKNYYGVALFVMISCVLILSPKAHACNSHKEYIKKEIDLKGATMTVPEGTILVFEGGVISNGKIVGNNTQIKANATLLFENVVIEGTWDNKTVFSQWLHFEQGETVDNAACFTNLMTLCKGERQTNLYFQPGTFYTSTKQGSSYIIVPSNIYWHNEATIVERPNGFSKSALVLIHKSNNVTIEGGQFIGDVRNHYGTEGEWGHGIKVAGGFNIVLRNLICQEFWGDGIDLIEGDYVDSISSGVGVCDVVTIDGVKCLYNRRLGLSIEAAKNVVVKNSEFAYTGKYGICDPGSGIDIEPWCTNEEKIDNISFYNCYTHDNHPQRDFCLEPNLIGVVRNKWTGNSCSNRITISNSKIGKLYIHGANTVTVKKCEIDEISQFNFAQNIKMNNCAIKKKSDLRERPGLTLRKCK